MSSSIPESLLVFSDVHLGSDIHDGAVNKARRSTAIDRDLVELLAHYRRQKPKAERWRIVIAGDFIDFIGISIPPEAELLETPATEEEQLHGIGNAADHARLKLRRVAHRHHAVFEALAQFVADGHALTIVHGNHDIEFHWDEVKEDFRELLHRTLDDPEACPRESFFERIEFNPWFFYRDGVAYIEHGHQYDAFCATTNVMVPLSPLDPRRVARGFSDTLLRYVVRPTVGMKEHGHETVGIAHYVGFGVRLGLSGMLSLARRFVLALVELFRLRSADLSEAAKILREEHELRIGRLAEASRIGKDRLQALLKLQTPPITSSIRGILASVLLDRLALALVTAMTLAVIAMMSAWHGHLLWGVLGVLAVWSLLNRYLARQRQVDPAVTLIDRASQLARLFPAAFVVMGHTHVPLAIPAGQSTYINVGSWSEEEPEGHDAPSGGYRAARTHLVIHEAESGAEAMFCEWSPEGPIPVPFPIPEAMVQDT